MKCEKVQGCIDAYIGHSLTRKELFAFIQHVKECPECYHELETYFIVDHTIRYLDDEGDGTYNIKKLLDEDLNRRLAKLKRRNILLQSLLVIVIIAGIIGMAGIAI